MWVRLQLDFSWWDFAYGMSCLPRPHNKASLAQSIQQCWPNSLVVLSVRSGFDLLLGAVGWPTGSEIVFSALNIPDMTMVARQHGIVPVPADLDLDRLAPDLVLLEKAITPRTKAILIAHLYGNFVDLAPIADLARKHGLLLIEDCAEIYDGVYTGHPEADVSLFSFGPLKTATSLAGGIVRARDSTLLERLQISHDRWPTNGRLDFFNRLCKYGTLKFFGSRSIYGAVRGLGKKFVGDMDKLIQHSAKSFRDDEIMVRLRLRPSGPLLASMARRLARFNHPRLARRIANGRLLTELLRGQVVCPGAEVKAHNYWLYPVMVSDPTRTLAELESADFDATRIESMRAIEAPPGCAHLDPVRTREALDRIILVPCYAEMPESELRRMAEVLIRVEQEANNVRGGRFRLSEAAQPVIATAP